MAVCKTVIYIAKQSILAMNVLTTEATSCVHCGLLGSLAIQIYLDSHSV
ncbi:hypothetical protein JL09_g6162, partial [Pichia kudriavzevii]